MENRNYTLNELTLYFLKLGAWGFGGPVALVGYMHRDLVEQKGCVQSILGRIYQYATPTPLSGIS